MRPSNIREVSNSLRRCSKAILTTQVHFHLSITKVTSHYLSHATETKCLYGLFKFLLGDKDDGPKIAKAVIEPQRDYLHSYFIGARQSFQEPDLLACVWCHPEKFKELSWSHQMLYPSSAFGSWQPQYPQRPGFAPSSDPRCNRFCWNPQKTSPE